MRKGLDDTIADCPFQPHVEEIAEVSVWNCIIVGRISDDCGEVIRVIGKCEWQTPVRTRPTERFAECSMSDLSRPI